jgi:hypothetical protein
MSVMMDSDHHVVITPIQERAIFGSRRFIALKHSVEGDESSLRQSWTGKLVVGAQYATDS